MEEEQDIIQQLELPVSTLLQRTFRGGAHCIRRLHPQAALAKRNIRHRPSTLQRVQHSERAEAQAAHLARDSQAGPLQEFWYVAVLVGAEPCDEIKHVYKVRLVDHFGKRAAQRLLDRIIIKLVRNCGQTYFACQSR